jgi:hypothetical protein
MNEAAALPSPAVLLSARLDRYFGRLRLPPGSRPLPGSSPVIGPERSGASPQNHRAGEGLPSSRRRYANVPSPLRRGVLRGCLQGLDPFHGLRRERRGSALPLSALRADVYRRGRLRFTLRTVRSLPRTGLSTLGFDQARFQTKPPACYRASWQLPGPDFHRQATTSKNESPAHLMGSPFVMAHSRVTLNRSPDGSRARTAGVGEGASGSE